jgi:hypothetical protein
LLVGRAFRDFAANTADIWVKYAFKLKRLTMLGPVDALVDNRVVPTVERPKKIDVRVNEYGSFFNIETLIIPCTVVYVVYGAVAENHLAEYGGGA